MATSATPDTPHTYDLHVWPTGMRLKTGDKGITPGPDSLSFSFGGAMRSYAYKDIAEINMLVTHQYRSPDVARITFTFKTGISVMVMNTSGWGNPDPKLNAEYNAFVSDLHQRIIAADAAPSIRFTSGFGANRHNFLKVVMVIASAFFIGLPIVLFFITNEAKALLIMLGGVFFLIPAFKNTARNTPQTYDPGAPPMLET